MGEDSKIRSLLCQVQKAYKDMIVNESSFIKEGNQFNVFNVLGLWSEEVRLHSAMIRELLDPSGSHGCSDRFLRLFFTKVYDINIPEKESLSKAIVDSEYYISQISEDGNEGGRIDILVSVPEELNTKSLIIENKIYALDQKNQLLRYYNFGKKKFKDSFILTYLTLDGKQPSTSSIGDGNNIEPICISYSNHIMTWLQSCAQTAFDKPKVREIIIQYIDLLKQITENTMIKKDEIVNIVASSEGNLISGLQICARRNEIVKYAVMKPITTFLKEIAERAEKELNHVQVEFRPNDDFNTRGERIDWGFSFFISSKDGKKVVKLIYIFEKWDLANLFYGIDASETHGVPVESIFHNTDKNWPYGWEWFDGYLNWDGEGISNILEQIKNNGINADFAKKILNSIIDAAKLCKVPCS